jgi:hypothetical protein
VTKSSSAHLDESFKSALLSDNQHQFRYLACHADERRREQVLLCKVYSRLGQALRVVFVSLTLLTSSPTSCFATVDGTPISTSEHLTVIWNAQNNIGCLVAQHITRTSSSIQIVCSLVPFHTSKIRYHLVQIELTAASSAASLSDAGVSTACLRLRERKATG